MDLLSWQYISLFWYDAPALSYENKTYSLCDTDGIVNKNTTQQSQKAVTAYLTSK